MPYCDSGLKRMVCLPAVRMQYSITTGWYYCAMSTSPCNLRPYTLRHSSHLVLQSLVLIIHFKHPILSRTAHWTTNLQDNLHFNHCNQAIHPTLDWTVKKPNVSLIDLPLFNITAPVLVVPVPFVLICSVQQCLKNYCLIVTHFPICLNYCFRRTIPVDFSRLGFLQCSSFRSSQINPQRSPLQNKPGDLVKTQNKAVSLEKSVFLRSCSVDTRGAVSWAAATLSSACFSGNLRSRHPMTKIFHLVNIYN